MNILIELPTWLGDTVMTTPAIENIVQRFPEAKITLFGSFISLEALKNHPNVITTVVDDSKSAKFRFLKLYHIAKTLGKFDTAFSFRRTMPSRLFLFFIDSKKRFGYKRYEKEEIHQVIRYNDFINKSLDISYSPLPLKLYYEAKIYKKPTLGINPGASYGSAKRWYPDRFGEVAKVLSLEYDIIIFGGPSEVDIAGDIQKSLELDGIKNFVNLAGKTSVGELIERIGGLSLFITGDSGPMHVAAAYQVPTVSLFGPTKHIETAQWMNTLSRVVRYDLVCAPCMKRKCPIKTHECMKLITADEVVKEARV